jgi:hypothetical protein
VNTYTLRFKVEIEADGEAAEQALSILIDADSAEWAGELFAATLARLTQETVDAHRARMGLPPRWPARTLRRRARLSSLKASYWLRRVTGRRLAWLPSGVTS